MKNTSLANFTTGLASSTSALNITNTASEQRHGFVHHQHHYPRHLATVLLLLIAIFALIGNSLVVIVITKIRRMQTFMNWMLFNLAVADLSASLLVLTLDVTQEFIPNKWVFGEVLCHLLFPLRSVSIFTSIFTLMCLSISRYWAIMYPFRRQPSVKFAKVLICCVWGFSFTLALPYTIGLKYQDDMCVEKWDKASHQLYTVLTFIFTYAIPVIVITIAYSQIVGETALTRRSSVKVGLACMNKDRQRENRQLIKLSMIISGTFSFCVLPYQIVWILYEFSYDFECFWHVNDVIMTSHLLLYLGSALNPIIYNIFSQSFREGFWELCTNVAGCHEKSDPPRKQSSYPKKELYGSRKGPGADLTFNHPPLLQSC